MKFKVILFGLIVLCSQQVWARNKDINKDGQDSVKLSLEYLNSLLSRKGNWYPQSNELESHIRGLIHYVEDERIDSVISQLNIYRWSQNRYFFRTPDNVQDSLKVPGYVSYSARKEKLSQIERSVRDNIVKEHIAIPEQLLKDIERKAKTLKEGEEYRLLGTNYVSMPDSLVSFGALPDSLIANADDFRRLQRMDSVKRALLEDARRRYNDFVIKQYIDSVSEAYREEYVRQYASKLQKEYSDSIRYHNYNLLVEHNEKVMAAVNDSVESSLRILKNFVDEEQVPVWFHNLGKDSLSVFLSNNNPGQSRFFVKNEQNDSLGVRVQALNRNAIRLLIDDGVTFTRFKQRQSKDVSFQPLQMPSSLDKVGQRFKVITPWTLGGNFNAGLTQSYYSNWKPGGTSSFALLVTAKAFANYASDKTSWENTFEIRNGWLKPADDGIQKNDDKVELTTRYGIHAYKKWYYSAELDFETQFFYGYKYPNRDKPISGYFSPLKTLIKVGMDYKPSKDLSLFLSPLTAKNVFVRDTARIDQTKFGIDEDKQRLWEAGLNADIDWKKNITNDISFQTKYKMFINYNAPFNKFDIDWKTTINFKLSNYITMQTLFHLVYDDNVTFPTNRVDVDGKTIYQPKWQFKEFFTIGFVYKLNKPVYKRKRLN